MILSVGLWASAVYLFHYRFFSVRFLFVCLGCFGSLYSLIHIDTYKNNTNTLHISPEIGRFVEQLQWKLKDFRVFFTRWLFGWSLNSQLGFSLRENVQVGRKTVEKKYKLQNARTHTSNNRFKGVQAQEKKFKQLKPIEFYLMWLCFVHASRVHNWTKLLFHIKLNRIWFFIVRVRFTFVRLSARTAFRYSYQKKKKSTALIPFSCLRPSFIQSINFRWNRCSNFECMPVWAFLCVCYEFTRHLMKRTSTWKRFFNRIFFCLILFISALMLMCFSCFTWLSCFYFPATYFFLSEKSFSSF